MMVPVLIGTAVYVAGNLYLWSLRQSPLALFLDPAVGNHRRRGVLLVADATCKIADRPDEMLLRDLAIQAAGILGILSGLVHGILGETQVFSRARIEPPWARLLVRLVWQCSSIAWVGIGGLLLVAPHLGSDSARLWIVIVTVVVYGFGAVANAWATKGRHFGWMLLTAAGVLALTGL
jgi:hypothetical protein